MALAGTGAMEGSTPVQKRAEASKPVSSSARAQAGAETQRGVSPATSDEQLMRQHQAGSRDAFAELFARYRDPLYGFFRRRLNDAARAEELAQDVFLAVLRGAERWEPRAAFRTWLYGIATRQLWAERRHVAREGGPAPAEAADPPAEAAACGCEQADAALAVRQAVARLDESDREVLLLREYEQLRYEEIAAVLGVPVGTVRSRLFRARMALKELLTEKKATGDERR